MLKTTGTILDEEGERWTVDCPKCGKEHKYKGYFDSSDKNECECGCTFLTTKIFFDNGDYFLENFQPKALRWLGFKVNLLIYSILPFLNAGVGLQVS